MCAQTTHMQNQGGSAERTRRQTRSVMQDYSPPCAPTMAALSRAILCSQWGQWFESLPRCCDLEQLFGWRELFGWQQGKEEEVGCVTSQISATVTASLDQSQHPTPRPRCPEIRPFQSPG
ncbi:hypothetical protein SRHO_G00018880 [Serrasalmus rhombeus]